MNIKVLDFKHLKTTQPKQFSQLPASNHELSEAELKSIAGGPMAIIRKEG
ncbi:MAG: hypothetical protein F6K42_28280 [Leptolyngbya sp. SIO1D8]|nr:hypothetical protein [Leptolyngbya sp. SIO1D8]